MDGVRGGSAQSSDARLLQESTHGLRVCRKLKLEQVISPLSPFFHEW